MPLDATPEERAFARGLVLDRLICGLWARVLSTSEDPLTGANEEAKEMVADLNMIFDHFKGRDGTVTRRLAIDEMEEAWDDITERIKLLMM